LIRLFALQTCRSFVSFAHGLFCKRDCHFLRLPRQIVISNSAGQQAALILAARAMSWSRLLCNRGNNVQFVPAPRSSQGKGVKGQSKVHHKSSLIWAIRKEIKTIAIRFCLYFLKYKASDGRDNI